ncbi:MAG: ATP-binding protein [Acidimicrobiales bacterium]
MADRLTARGLLLLALVLSILGLVAVSVVVDRSDRARSDAAAEQAQEVFLWPGASQVIESLHGEAILAAQTASGAEQRSAQQGPTNGAFDSWTTAGANTIALRAQLRDARAASEDPDRDEARELLLLADQIRSNTLLKEPAPTQLLPLLIAARADAEIAVTGVPYATASSIAKAQKRQIEGMVAVADVAITAAAEADDNSLVDLLSVSSDSEVAGDVRTTLIAGDAVSISNWIDTHIARQSAIGEVSARLAAPLPAPTPVESELPFQVGAIATGAALLSLLLMAAGIRRPVTGTGQLVDAMSMFAKEVLPAVLSSDSDTKLGDNIDLLEIQGPLGPVAAAFNEVQLNAAYVVDQDRAEHQLAVNSLFRSIAVRNKELIVKQLDLLDELEVGEPDDERLELLLRLDGYVSRMRRDFESLQALAGDPSGHDAGDDRELAELLDIAVDETRGRERIRLVEVDEALIDGLCAGDVAHVLTELIENALDNSPSESLVDVVANLTESGSLVISIADDGDGMSPEQTEAVNAVLECNPEFTAGSATTLGFAAMAALTARALLTVRLTNSPTQGLMAIVTIPAEMVEGLTQVEEPSPQPSFASDPDSADPDSAVEEHDTTPIVTAGEPGPIFSEHVRGDFDRNLPVAEFEFESGIADIKTNAEDDLEQPEESDESAEDDWSLLASVFAEQIDEEEFAGDDGPQADKDIETVSAAAQPDSVFAAIDLDANPFENGPDETDEADEVAEASVTGDPDEIDAEWEAISNRVGETTIHSSGITFSNNETEPLSEREPTEQLSPTTFRAAVSTVANPNFAALDSLLANLPRRAGAAAVQAPAGLARRIPNGSSGVSPSGLRPKSGPEQGKRSPEEVRMLLAKYKSGRSAGLDRRLD